MSGPRFAESAKAYWTALGRRDAMPDLPDEPFDAFVELLHAGAEGEHAFELVEYGATPYPQILLGDKTKPFTVQWAIELAELEPFVQKGERELTFLADSHPDPNGRHRVYSLEDGIRGMLEFADLPHALTWMAAKVEATRSGAPVADAAASLAASLEDPWEESNSSGFYVLETLLDLPFGEAWESYSRGEWPVVDVRVPQFRFRRQGPWQRSLALHLVHRFLTNRIVDLPRSLKPAELSKAVRALVANLQSFEEAMAAGMAPEAIDALTDSKDGKLAKLARDWIARHDAWRESLGKPVPVGGGADDDDDDFDDEDGEGADDDDGGVDAALAAVMAKVLGKKPGGGLAPGVAPFKRGAKPAAAPEPEPAKKATKATKSPKAAKAAATEALVGAPPPEPVPEPDTPFIRSLRVALTAALDAMIQAELLDLAAERKPALLAELLEAGANARSAAHLLKSLTDAIVSSDHVEEVYATDDEVERFIRKRLEQR